MIEKIFTEIDDFCLHFEPEFNQFLMKLGCKKRNKKETLSISEVATIVVMFHRSGYRYFNCLSPHRLIFSWNLLSKDWPDIQGYCFATFSIPVQKPEPPCLVATMCRELKIAEYIDARITNDSDVRNTNSFFKLWDESPLSFVNWEPGTELENGIGIILCILYCQTHDGLRLKILHRESF